MPVKDYTYLGVNIKNDTAKPFLKMLLKVSSKRGRMVTKSEIVTEALDLWMKENAAK